MLNFYFILKEKKRKNYYIIIFKNLFVAVHNLFIFIFHIVPTYKFIMILILYYLYNIRKSNTHDRMIYNNIMTHITYYIANISIFTRIILYFIIY